MRYTCLSRSLIARKKKEGKRKRSKVWLQRLQLSCVQRQSLFMPDAFLPSQFVTIVFGFSFCGMQSETWWIDEFI